MSKQLTKQEILNALPNFTGSTTFTNYEQMMRARDILTDGAMFVAEECQAFWLMDAIASHQTNPKVRAEEFQVWVLLKYPAGKWQLSADDGNDNDIARQSIEYSDFPLDSIRLYAVRNELGGITIMLPSEY